ncbi:TonB-dependent receptor [Eleftheria terrae]|uniref:TonB-dependent receptor n=1 Tax=Eleftheria terrae TaxID=1597781 RepID=UPI00263AD56A|nr:TonB-dependent siderophore receptor [Eleftheria terrae]WKB55725.1 TonB-dependent siderophore receptor [Eleftheria terrae]
MTELPSSRHVLSLACLAALSSFAPCAGAQEASTASDRALPAVTVKAKQDRQALPAAAPGGLSASGARLGVLGNTPILDAPVSLNAYTQQAIQTQQARTLADVLQNDPAVRYTTNSGHMQEHFRIRGLDVNAPDVAFNGLYGVAPTAHVPTEMLERVEVLRGPSALLSGMSPSGAVGGMVNLVPKRAGSRPLTELTMSYSSKSYAQAHLDLARRFGEDQRLGVRVNTVYGTGDTGVDDQEKGRRLAALGLDYLGDQWNLTLDAYTSRETIDNGSPAMYGFAARRGKAVGIGRLLSPPDSDTNLFRGTHGDYRDHGIAVRGELKLNDRWTARAGLGASNSEGKGLMFGTRVVVTGLDGSAAGYVYNVKATTRGRTAELGVRGEFETGTVAHRLDVSATVLKIEDGTGSTPREGWAQNIYRPVAPMLPAAPSTVKPTSDNRMTSLNIADTMSLASGKVLLTVGARLQRVEQKLKDYKESAVSPSLGVVVKPWGEDSSLFANYMQGLSPGETVPIAGGYANEGEIFPPIKSRQVELGVKHRQGALTHTLSAFRITRPTLVDENVGSTKRRTEGGDQRVRGVEWNAFGQLGPVGVLGGVSYLQSEQRNTGRDNYGVPDWTANLGATWATPVEGLSLSGRLVYTGRQWVDSANTLELPSSTRLDAGVRYATALGGTPVTINAFVENLANRRYWSGMFADGYVMPGGPRTLRVATTFAF